MSYQILVGHAIDVMRTLDSESVNCIVTSIPYWGLRDYGVEPSVWGGVEACDHSWAEPESLRRVGRDWDPTSGDSPVGRVFSDVREPVTNGKSRTTDRFFGSESRKVDGNHQKHVMPGSFCSKCGAWHGCLGLEPTPALFVEHIVDVFREARRVLRKDGTCWLNVGDSYFGTGGDRRDSKPGPNSCVGLTADANSPRDGRQERNRGLAKMGLKPKDRCMIPARVAIALCDDGWYLRDEIIWHKPNPMPSSVTDRTTPAHEMLYLLTKSKRYWYNAEAIKEPSCWGSPNSPESIKSPHGQGFSRRAQRVRAEELAKNGGLTDSHISALVSVGISDAGKAQVTQDGFGKNADETQRLADEAKAVLGGYFREFLVKDTRNKRSVWTIATQPYPEAHFATFPVELPKLCILAGCPVGGTVLDMFGGSGTTIAVAESLRRNGIYIDLKPEYADLAKVRIGSVTPPLPFEVSA